MKRQSCVLFALLALLCPGDASALPIFARKYRTSCVTCHEMFPRLNAVGQAFRLAGYRFDEDEAYIKDEPLMLGQEAYKKVWPKAIWPGDIPGLPPVSFRMNFDLDFNRRKSDGANSGFVFPVQARLHSAGAMGDRMSYFLELEFNREGGETEVELSGWLQFEDLFGPENMFNLRIGTMGFREFGLLTAQPHDRLTRNNYLYAGYTLPAIEGMTSSNGYMIMQPQPGVEINGYGHWWRYAIGVVNGNGSSVADNNQKKDFYAQLTFKIGGLGFDGRKGGGGDDEEDAEELGESTGSDIWRDDSLTISFFGYTGWAPVASSVTTMVEVHHEEEEEEEGMDMDEDEHGEEEPTMTSVTSSSRNEDHFWRLGVGVSWKYKDLRLGAGVVGGQNSRPYAGLDSGSVHSLTWFVEAEYFIYPWLMPSVRYEELYWSGLPALAGNQDQRRVVVTINALLRANVKLYAEALFMHKEPTRMAHGGGHGGGGGHGLTTQNQFKLGVELAF